MPHYKDGTPAKVGDFVIGTPYNTNGKEIVGTVLQVTAADACNLTVAFAETPECDLPCSVYGNALVNGIAFTIIGTANPSGIEEKYPYRVKVIPRYDYGATKDFLPVKT